jgi:hypothetical protein
MHAYGMELLSAFSMGLDRFFSIWIQLNCINTSKKKPIKARSRLLTGPATETSTPASRGLLKVQHGA